MQEKIRQAKMELRTFLLCLLVVSICFFWLLKPFFGPIFWACAIAIIFYPIQTKLLKRLNGRRNLTALLTLLLCIVIVVIPVVGVVSSAVGEGVNIYQKIESGEIKPGQYVEKLRAAFPVVEDALTRFGVDINNLKENVAGVAMSSGKILAQQTLTIGQNTFLFLVDIFLMLYLTFFMLRDGSKLIDMLIRALPLGDAREKMLFSMFAEVTRATVKGNLVVAIVQGALGGLIFWLLGIPGVLLWAVLMTLASLIPAVGPALIWAPVALYLLAIGDTTQSLILIAFGAGVIGLVDNILRPILVGRDTKLPDYIVLLSTLGGLAIFGINGFVIGPLIAALFMAFWGIFMREVNVPS